MILGQGRNKGLRPLRSPVQDEHPHPRPLGGTSRLDRHVLDTIELVRHGCRGTAADLGLPELLAGPLVMSDESSARATEHRRVGDWDTAKGGRRFPLEAR